MVSRRTKYGSEAVNAEGATLADYRAVGLSHEWQKAFDSRREYRRWCQLANQERQGAISGLRLQVPFRLEVNGVLVCVYVADFFYCRGLAIIIEDCKGFRTPEYQIKKKLMMAVYGIDILET